MKYRVIYSVGYNDAWFEFDTIEAAGEFAKIALIHQVPNEDTSRKVRVSIQIVDAAAEEEESEE